MQLSGIKRKKNKQNSPMQDYAASQGSSNDDRMNDAIEGRKTALENQISEVLRNNPETIFSGGGGLRDALGLKPNQNIVVLPDGTFAIQTFGEKVEVADGTYGEYRVRHYGNTQSDINSASAVLDAYTNTLSVSKWANNGANTGTVNAIDNAFATGRIYSVDGVDGGRFYTGAGETGNVFIGTQNSQGGFASGLEIAGLIAHEGTHVYQYALGLDPRVQLSEYAAHAAQYSVMKGMSSYTLTAQEMQSIDNGYNFAAANDYAASNPAGMEITPDNPAVFDMNFGSLYGSDVEISAAAYANYVGEDVDSLFGDTQSPIQSYYEYIPPTLSDIYSDAELIAKVKEYSQLNNVSLTNEQMNSLVETFKNASVDTYDNNFNQLISEALDMNTAGNIFGASNSPLPVYSDVYSDAEISEQVQQYVQNNHLPLTNEELAALVESVKNAAQFNAINAYNSNFDALISDARFMNNADRVFGDANSNYPTFLDIASAENVDIIARVNQTIAANNFALTAEQYNAYIEKIMDALQNTRIGEYNNNFEQFFNSAVYEAYINVINSGDNTATTPFDNNPLLGGVAASPNDEFQSNVSGETASDLAAMATLYGSDVENTDTATFTDLFPDWKFGDGSVAANPEAAENVRKYLSAQGVTLTEYQLETVVRMIAYQAQNAPAALYNYDYATLCNTVATDYLASLGALSDPLDNLLPFDVPSIFPETPATPAQQPQTPAQNTGTPANTPGQTTNNNNSSQQQNPQTPPSSGNANNNTAAQNNSGGISQLIQDLSRIPELKDIADALNVYSSWSSPVPASVMVRALTDRLNQISTEAFQGIERNPDGSIIRTSLVNENSEAEKNRVSRAVAAMGAIITLSELYPGSVDEATLQNAITTRNQVVRSLLPLGDVNTQNLKQLNLFAVSPNFTEGRTNVEGTGVRLDAGMTFTTAKDMVRTFDLLYLSGVRLNGFMFNGHGINGTSYSENNEANGFYYGNRNNYVAKIESTGEVIWRAGNDARSWSDLNMRLFNSGSVFSGGFCSWADDAEKLAGIFNTQNPGVRATFLGRNFDGNYAGAPSPDAINKVLSGAAQPLALMRYIVNTDGTISNQTIRHPASDYLYDAQGRRVNDAESRRQFYATANALNPVPRFTELFRQTFNGGNNQ